MIEIVKFVSKYADEVLSVAEGMATLLDGVALRPEDTAKVQAIIDKLQAASASVKESAPNIKVTINAKDIDAAVARYMTARGK